MKVYGWLALLALMLAAQSAHATLYRWVDENGRVQYSDKPPVTPSPKGISTLDSQGLVRTNPPARETPEEAAKRAQQLQDSQDQQRRDRALMQSFSNPKEIDILRDRQIDAVKSGLDGNRTRRQAAQAKLAGLNGQMDSFKRKNKHVPDDMQADATQIQKELADIDADDAQKNARIMAIREKAEADKKRLAELQSGAR